MSCCYKLYTFWRKLFSKKWRCFYQFSGSMLEVWQQSQLFSFELCTEQTHPRFSNQAWRLSPTVAKMQGVSEEVFSKNAPAVRLQRNHPARNGESSGYRSATTHPVNSGCLNCSSWLIWVLVWHLHQLRVSSNSTLMIKKFHYQTGSLSVQSTKTTFSNDLSVWSKEHIKELQLRMVSFTKPLEYFDSCMPVNEFLQFDR